MIPTITYLKNVNYTALEQKISAILTKILKTLSFIAMSLLAFATIKNIFVVKHSLVPFTVPLVFEEAGISGRYVTLQLDDEFSRIQQSGWSINGLYLDTEETTEIQDDVIIFGNSLNSTIALIRDIIGIKNRTITGALIQKADLLHLRISLTDHPSITINIAVNEYENRFQAYDQLIKVAAKEILKVIDPFVLASYFWAEKKPTKFLNMVDFILQSENNNKDDVYLLWGNFLHAEEDYAQAASKLEKAVTLNPNNQFAWNGWGLSLMAIGECDNALRKFKRAIHLDKTLWDPWFQSGTCLATLGKHHQAITQFKQAIALKPNDFLAYNQIAYSYQAINQLSVSIQYLQQGIAQASDTATLHATLAEMYWESGDKQQAFKALQQAERAGFDPTEYHNIEPYSSYLDNRSPDSKN